MKINSITKKLVKLVNFFAEFCQILNKPSKIAKDIWNFAKVAKFS